MTVVQRSVATDVNSTTGGRFAVAGTTNYTGCVVQADVAYATPDSTGAVLGVLARYTDVNNWVRAVINVSSTGGHLSVDRCVAGAATTIGSASASLAPDTWYTVKLYVDAQGYWWTWLSVRGGIDAASPLANGQDDALATGGSLATGKVGFYDASTSGD